MLIVVFNAGSSSLKCQLIDTKTGKSFFESIVDRVGQKQCEFRMKAGKKSLSLLPKVTTITQAMQITSEILLSQKIFGKQKIAAVAHRVVHGGERYYKPTMITPAVMKELARLCELAPLHNPPNIEGIKSAQKIFKHLPQIAVFDTGFYHDMPEHAYLYAVPLEWHRKFGVRKYGFHGISHEHVIHKALKKISGPLSLRSKKNTKIISCHLGNGCSITASLGGKAMDTSMGFTPLEGIPMGTRSGSVDPALVPFLAKKMKCSADEIVKMLNKESGLKGLSGISSDMRDIRAGNLKKNAKTMLAYEIYVYHISMQIAAYTAALHGLDALVFTAGIGENAEYLRKDVLAHLTHLKSFKTLVIPTNEELHIAELSAKLL